MLRVELVGAAIALTIIWIIAMIFTLTQGGRPPAGLILSLVTIATCGMWGSVWGSCTRARMAEHQKKIDSLTQRVSELEEERDVDLAMARLKPHLRIVGKDHHH